MEAARQSKINTYANELTNISYTAIHNEGLLQDVNNGIGLYKNRAITKVQLTRVYKKCFETNKVRNYN